MHSFKAMVENGSRFLSNLRILQGSSATDSAFILYSHLISKASSGTIIGAHQSFQNYSTYDEISTSNSNSESVVRKMNLAESLAVVVDESTQSEDKTRTRKETKKILEACIKKRVKEQFRDGKYQELMTKVVAHPKTLMDAYNSIRVESNIDVSAPIEDVISFESLAEELSDGKFMVASNTFSLSTRGARKETLVLPNLKLRVVQEAIRIVLEVVYRPHFSKISHGGRSGRGHSSALRFICKEISEPNWWFTVLLRKNIDDQVISKLFSTMADKIKDPGLYGMIRSMFEAQVLNLEFGGFPKSHGLPQEGVLSTILMNIYLDLFDREFFQMQMKFEALGSTSQDDGSGQHSRLRSWFRRNLKGLNMTGNNEETSLPRIYACRFMDEIFFAVSGSEDVALDLKSHVQSYLQNTLYLDTSEDIRVLACDGSEGIRFLGTLLKRTITEIPTFRAVHKLKDKVKLFALQKQEIWSAGTVRVGKKWLAHGVRKVKESEINHLADSSSVLTKISCHRKTGMETDHWYKQLMKIWMQSVNAKAADSEEVILSKYIAEPSLPSDLRDSYYEFQKQVEKYVSSETIALLSQTSNSSTSGCQISTEVMAPINVIKSRLFRYRVTNKEGYGRPSSLLLLMDKNQIIDWYSGIVNRWLGWYSECHNCDQVKFIISNELRMSCIRTLALKYRIHESEIVKRFDSELTKIPSTEEIEHEMDEEVLNSSPFTKQTELAYDASYSGICLLSLARLVSYSRPCTCFTVGCSAPASCVYTLHVMERQKFPGWKTGFASCIHPSLNRRRIGLCKQHVQDLFLGHISLLAVDFGSWK